MSDDEARERAYVNGSERAWLTMLNECRRQLGFAGPAADPSVTLAVETRLALRAICEEFGDNDWPDDLHPADVIEKHLARHIREREDAAWERSMGEDI